MTYRIDVVHLMHHVLMRSECNALSLLPSPGHKVIDSRLHAEGSQIRRRRVCPDCDQRFSTYESAELVMPRIVKSNGQRENFDEDKLRRGLTRALEKRPVSTVQIDACIQRIKRRCNRNPIRKLNHVASEIM